MNCKACGYRLWNLPPGACPECGVAFKPSDFDFRRDAVQFCCPKCSQDYYGTDEMGHLVPRAFTCVRCGEPTEMDRMFVRPAGGVDEDSTARDRNPWIDRRRRGLLKGFFATLGRGMVMPHRLLAVTPVGGTPDALWFLLLSQTFFLLLNFVPMLLFLTLMGLVTGGVTGTAWTPLLGVVGLFVGMFAVLVLLLFLWALVTHGLLRLTGPTAHGLGRTFQCLAYTSGGNCVIAIPCFGQYFGFLGSIWWVIAAAAALTQGQSVGKLRAGFSAALFPAILFAAGIGLVVWAIIAINNTVTRPPGPLSSITMLSSAFASHSLSNGGSPPEHASQLLPRWSLTGESFVSPMTATLASDVPLADSTLDAFDLAGPAEQARLASAAAAALPPRVAAHRLGDYVFTYHGISLLPPPDPSLWVIVEWADPDANPGWTPVAVGVVRADGAILSLAPADWPGQLQQQNALRARFNLPPLPTDFSTITHAQPAVAP